MRFGLRRLRVGGLALAMVAGLGVVTGSIPAVAEGSSDSGWASAGIRTSSVTLVTGDRVLLGPGKHMRVEPAPGREKMHYSRESMGGDVYVIPADAMPLVASGKLDRRLFNVTKLVEFGYDDRSRADVPLIVEYADGQVRSQPAALSAGGARVQRALPSIGGASAAAPKKRASQFWASLRGAKGSVAGRAPVQLAAGVERVWLDGPVRASLDRSVAQVGAPQAWQAGYTGKGVTVAVLDSGIDATHPDLADAVVGAHDFTGGAPDADDGLGHGTHVASIITGSGAASGGKYAGMAPDASLLNGKVLNDDGRGPESWIIAGMEWAATQGADVINMSLGGEWTDGRDPMSQAVNELTRQTGALFVVAAGNSGEQGEQTIGSPGAADAALTVGAVDRSDQLAWFSSMGPRRGDFAIKPDITGPGVDIVAARATKGKIGTPGEAYVALPGTSMAAPHVAGAAAILAGQHPDWSAEQLKSVLMGTAVPNNSLSVYQQGAGRLDVARAVTAQVSASPGSVSLGLAQWPHDDDKPVATKVTYHNSGTAAVTFDLAVTVRHETGQAPPAGMFTVSPSQVTVPAGGSATVTLTSDTSVPAPDGRYSGAVVARGADGQASVRTPVAVTREAESYNLTIEYADRNGQATPWFGSKIVDLDHDKWYLPWDPSGKVTMRLPKGRYYFDAWVYDGFDFMKSTTIVEPTIELTADIKMAADARKGKPIDVRLDRSEADAGLVVIRFIRDTAWGGEPFREVIAFSFDGVYVSPSETTAPGEEFTVLMDADLAKPDGRGGFAGSPYFYRVRWLTYGRVPETFEPRFRDRDLVRVTSTHAAATPGRTGVREHMVTGNLPFSLTEYYSPGMPQFAAFSEPDGSPSFAYGENGPVKAYTGDKPLTERWNYAVFGPAFPHKQLPVTLAGREGNRVRVNIPMYADQGRDHVGYSRVDSASTKLYRNGELVGDSPYPLHGFGDFEVPGGAATYRLEADSTRTISDLSTRVAASWTFRSDTVNGAPQPLPLLAVRFTPNLDDHNKAHGGRSFPVPVYAQRNGDAAAPKLTNITVQASYDDGATWQPVRLSSTGDEWLALMSHPMGAQFVSLKATATDTEGNSVEQTIIRAYGLK